MEIDIDRPAADAWKRVGKFCDIGKRFQMPAPCTITSGKDGEFGAVRAVANEILVGKTELSYTYTHPVRDGVRYNMYRGTLEARPVTATTSKIVYTSSTTRTCRTRRPRTRTSRGAGRSSCAGCRT